MKRITFWSLFIIATIGILVRLYGLNWDQGQHLHPDERFLTIVSEKVRVPASVQLYLDSRNSPLSPYNNGFNFYVYGTFPLLITRIFADIFRMNTYDNIYIVGRMLSVVFDVGTGVLVYALTKKLFSNERAAVFASFTYIMSVFPIQQAHFFTVDSFLVFFSTFAVLLFTTHLKNKSHSSIALSGLFFGLSISTKTSIAIVAPLFYLFLCVVHFRKPLLLLKNLVLFTVVTAVTFRLFQPYAFSNLYGLSPLFISNIQEAHRMITGEINYPPNVQWTGTLVIVHPLVQLFLWGLGPVTSTVAAIGGYLVTKSKKLLWSRPFLFISSFMALIFIYHGIQLAKYMRYFYPIYPFFAVLAGYAISQIKNKKLLFLCLFLMLIWPMLFLSIYGKSHSRVAASKWMYQNIRSGSKITSEEWDDSLPLSFYNNSNQQYEGLSLPMFQDDSSSKWQTISSTLEKTDYVVLASNRVYDAVVHRPSVYPITNRYYSLLRDGALGFTLVGKFSSFPELGPFKINDSSAEESFTVYDHPRVLIYKKTKFLNKLDIMNLLYTP